MSNLNFISRDKIDRLFNDGGYVLDFTTDQFDSFTFSSVGIRICEEFGLSKGKSLRKFIKEKDDFIVKKLLHDLLEYYEYKYQGIMRDDIEKLV